MQMKKAWPVFWVVLCVCIPIRIFQQIFLIDRSTGFYTDGKATFWIISLILILGILGICWLYFREKTWEEDMEKTPVIQHRAAAVFAMVCGFLLIGVGVYSYTGIPVIKNEGINIVFVVTGILAGCTMLINAYDLISGENHLDRFPFLGLFTPLWECVCVVGMFIAYADLVNEAERLYDTGTMLFQLLFLFAYSKYMAGLDGRRKLFLYGFPAAMLSAITGIPAFVMGVFGIEQGSAFPISLHLLNLSIGVYAWQILRALDARKPKSSLISKEEKKPIISAESNEFSAEEAALEEHALPSENAEYSWSREDEQRCRDLLMEHGGKELFIMQKKSPYDEKF